MNEVILFDGQDLPSVFRPPLSTLDITLPQTRAFVDARTHTGPQDTEYVHFMLMVAIGQDTADYDYIRWFADQYDNLSPEDRERVGEELFDKDSLDQLEADLVAGSVNTLPFFERRIKTDAAKLRRALQALQQSPEFLQKHTFYMDNTLYLSENLDELLVSPDVDYASPDVQGYYSSAALPASLTDAYSFLHKYGIDLPLEWWQEEGASILDLLPALPVEVGTEEDLILSKMTDANKSVLYGVSAVSAIVLGVVLWRKYR